MSVYDVAIIGGGPSGLAAAAYTAGFQLQPILLAPTLGGKANYEFRLNGQYYPTPIWGLETGFGADNGRFRTMQALATLAYDCRRSAQFHEELNHALKIVERGDMSPAQMRGDWAGEIGQTRFMPSSYLKYGVDFDGNGHVDLRHSVPDVLASTANLLHVSGFKGGAPYGEGTPNFEAMREWNRATIYRKTIGYFADKLVGR